MFIFRQVIINARFFIHPLMLTRCILDVAKCFANVTYILLLQTCSLKVFQIFYIWSLVQKSLPIFKERNTIFTFLLFQYFCHSLFNLYVAIAQEIWAIFYAFLCTWNEVQNEVLNLFYSVRIQWRLSTIFKMFFRMFFDKVKVCISWKSIQYIIHRDKTQILKKNFLWIK